MQKNNLINNSIFQIKQCKDLATMPIRVGEELNNAAMFKNGDWYNIHHMPYMYWVHLFCMIFSQSLVL